MHTGSRPENTLYSLCMFAALITKLFGHRESCHRDMLSCLPRVMALLARLERMKGGRPPSNDAAPTRPLHYWYINPARKNV